MKRYDSYKDSGIEWIGDIPEHWNVMKFNYLFSFSRGLPITKQDLKDEGIPCINYGEIHSKFGFKVNPKKHFLKCVESDYMKSSGKSLLNRGDFVFADTSEDIEGSGNFTCLDSNTLTFAGYHTIIAIQKHNNYYIYLAYFFDSLEFRNQIRSEVSGIKVFSITQAILKNSDVLLPPLPEQTAIANFLDRKTTEIDQLIADKKRLVELYEEEKTAVINQAVTKGIDPNVKMKESGIEWLGEIPEHWEVKRLKFIIEMKSGSGITSELITDEGEYPVYGGNGLRGYFNSFTHDGNFVLIGRQGALCGNINYGIGKFWASEHALVCSPKTDYIVNWLGELLRIMNLNQYSVSAAQPGLSVENLNVLLVPVPCIVEQQSIVNQIETECTQINAKIEKTKKLIGLLMEYRTTLISEVVTGKIKITD